MRELMGEIWVKKKKKLSRQTIVFGMVTVGVLLLGISFGQVINQTLVPTASSQDDKPPTEVLPDNVQTAVTQEAEMIYLLQLGVFESYDNLLALVNDIQRLGLNYGVVKEADKYVVYSHIVKDKKELADVEALLKENKLSYFIKTETMETKEAAKYYFLQAVLQRPFEMSDEFVQSFSTDEMHIFGYYTTLSTTHFEPLTSGRQRMLLDIYQWLHDE